MKMRIIVYGDGTHWLFTGTGMSQRLAIADAARIAGEYVEDFVIKAAYDPLAYAK